MSTTHKLRLPTSTFHGLTEGDVRTAIARYRAGDTHKFSDSIRYDLIFQGERYPPKAIFGLAAERLLARQLSPSDFAGGLGSVCFRTLTKLGYSVVAKKAIETLPEEALELLDEILPKVGPAESHGECPLTSLTSKNTSCVGKRRLSRRAKKLGDRAEECVFKQLEVQQQKGLIRHLRWLAKEGKTPGWDIQYEDLTAQNVCRVEVKGTLASSIAAFDLTTNELNAALEYGQEYAFALVTDTGSVQPKVYYLWNV